MLGSITSLAAASTSSGGGGISILIFLALMAFVFYFLLIRPQKRQRQQQRALIESVDVGDEVMTVGGMYGTVKAVDDESVTVEVAPNVDIRFAKTAIARKLVYDEEEYEEEEEGSPEATDQSEEESPTGGQRWKSGPWFDRGRRRSSGDRNANEDREAGEQS